MHKNRQLKQEYLENPPRMGIFQIRNLVNEKILVMGAFNLPGIINRHQFELRSGSHKNRELQAEWSELGGDRFVFEILDELTPPSSPDTDPRADLLALEDLWLDKLQPYGERGYNQRKKSREERLRMIADLRRRVQSDEAESLPDSE